MIIGGSRTVARGTLAHQIVARGQFLLLANSRPKCPRTTVRRASVLRATVRIPYRIVSAPERNGHLIKRHNQKKKYDYGVERQ
jgi:hypothetical protein